MIADRLAWAALVAVLWLTLASFAFLWMAGLLNSPGIHAWARPWQWLTYARLFGRSTNEQIYLVASGLLAAAPFAAYVRFKAFRPRLRAARLNEPPPALVRAFSDVYGHADFMSGEKMQKLAQPGDPVHGGIVFGAACRADLTPAKDGGTSPLLIDRCTEDATHGLLFLGSGGGKTSAYAVPTLDPEVAWRGNVLANDPSSQMGRMCASMREQAGQRVIFLGGPRPARDSSGMPQPQRVGINVLGWIDPAHPLFEEHVWSAVETLGREVVAAEAKGENSMFKIQGKSLQACLLADMLADPTIAKERRTPGLFAERIATPERQMKGLLQTIHEESKSRLARILAGTLMEAHAKTFSGFCVEATADLRWLMTETYANIVSGTAPGSITADDFARGDMTIFLQLGVKTMEDTPQIGRAILNALLNNIYRADGETGRKYLLLLDEINLFGKLQALSTAASQGRKYGVTIMGMWHSLGQMDATWGPAGVKAWRANASWEAYSAMDRATAEDVSKRCGRYTVIAPSEGRNTGSSSQAMFGMRSSSKGTNESTSLQARDLITPDEVEFSMRRDEAIVFRRGESAPIRCVKAYYFLRPDMRARVGQDQYRIAAE